MAPVRYIDEPVKFRNELNQASKCAAKFGSNKYYGGPDNDKTALVTGGTRGIGKAISIALKDAGYSVIANYAGNDEAAEKFTNETGIPVNKFNVADYDACAKNISRNR